LGDTFDSEPTFRSNARRTSFHLKKSLGQHFLRNRDFAARIARQVAPGQRVVEIGPGDGSLTQELLERNLDVTAIEVDADLIPELKRRFHRQRDSFRLVVSDVLDVNWRELWGGGAPLTVVGNLPYNIGSQIIVRLLDVVRANGSGCISNMIFTLQKEVAERITSEPGGRVYGGITVLVNYHATTQYLFTIPASEFFPKPEVDGGVVMIAPRQSGELPEVDYYLLRRIVRGCFSQRRKVLRNALRVVNDLPNGWQNIEFEWTRRPETFSIHEFIRLTQELVKLGMKSSPGASAAGGVEQSEFQIDDPEGLNP
jgi:16S rRNA (adenine1518-N6/adenine1519-N6)-dimethyltransferase